MFRQIRTQLCDDPNLCSSDRISDRDMISFLRFLAVLVLVQSALIYAAFHLAVGGRLPVSIADIRTEYANPFVLSSNGDVLRISPDFRGVLIPGQTCLLRLDPETHSITRAFGCTAP